MKITTTVPTKLYSISLIGEGGQSALGHGRSLYEARVSVWALWREAFGGAAPASCRILVPDGVSEEDVDPEAALPPHVYEYVEECGDGKVADGLGFLSSNLYQLIDLAKVLEEQMNGDDAPDFYAARNTIAKAVVLLGVLDATAADAMCDGLEIEEG